MSQTGTIEPGSRPVLCIHGKPIGEHCLCREEMPSTPEPAAMTIAGIIEREVAKIATSNHYITSADTRAACLAVAKSVVEEARKIARGFAEQGDWDKDTALGIEGTIDEELAARPAKEGR